MEQKINIQINKLKSVVKESKYWMMASIVVITTMPLLVFDIIKNTNNHILMCVLIGLGLGISVGWWFWTMRLIRGLINQRMAEGEVLKEVLQDIKEIKKDFSINKD
jgi:hypothetical protein